MKYMVIILVLASAIMWTPVVADEQSVTNAEVRALIEEIDQLYRSESSYAVFEMEIVTPHYQRTLAMEAWSLGTKKTLIRINAPRKEKGVSTLRIDNEMWNYLPKTDRVIRIPPSMMMSSWMGSDFTNDDLVQEFSLFEDYSYELTTPDSARDDLGVFTRQLHLSAFLPTTRVTHARRHGTLHTTADQEQWYQEDGNAINCYLPDTTVRGRFVAGSKAYYCGHIINIVTATGRNLSVTPNHPIMTHGGLVAAAELREGDDLIAYSPEVEDLAGVGDLDNDDAYTTIEHVFGSLVEVGHSSNRRVMGIDFHGDAVAMQKHIDVVDVERPLDVAVDASLPKALHDLSFVMADPILHSEGGSLALDLVGVDLPSPSFIGGACKIFSGLWTHLTGSIKACIALSPVFQTSTVEPSVKGYPGDAGLPADLQDGLPGDVVSMELGDIKQMFEGRIVAPLYIDRIVSIVRVDYSGHVYDLQEVSGLMVANGIIASNCRCSTSEVLVDSNGNPENPAFIAKVKGDGRSFFKKEDVL